MFAESLICIMLFVIATQWTDSLQVLRATQYAFYMLKIPFLPIENPVFPFKKLCTNKSFSV